MRFSVRFPSCTTRRWLAPLATSSAPVALCLLTAGAAGCVVKVDSNDYKVRDERRFRVDGVADIRLATFDGAIAVRGWDRDEVYVEVEKRGRDRDEVQAIEIVADQNGRQISVEARQPSATKYAFGVVTTRTRDARMVASVPANSNLMLRTGDGAISVERINGRLELRTSDGNISGLDLKGDVFANTEQGHLRIEGVDGRCDLVTSDGSITLQGRLDGLRARTGDGAVVVKVLPGSRSGGEWSVSTGDGALVVYVPEQFGAEIDAETQRGSVKVDPTLSLTSAGDLPRGVFRGTLATGGHVVRLRTRDGGIAIKRLPGKPALPPPTELER
jgi:Putative adhesin